MMAAAGTDWNDLDAVAVSQGPGSFTGLRIGMAAAKGIAMAAEVPLIGVHTLDGLAAQVTAIDLPVCCLLDARKQQVYAAFYRYGDDFSYRRTSKVLVLSPEELVKRIEEPTLVAGPGIKACHSQLTSHQQVRLLHARFIHPRAALIGFCGARVLGEGTVKGMGADLVPLYVRASEAELNLR
jgi:tRNA threonylcarbamoyladenosine biosynthesis protein TsaB